ncbi:MAG: LacI family transcriptional regulator [Chloroflexi bacterium]|nr:LacI family transcriptional regulator [Chloroflexota bacterium]
MARSRTTIRDVAAKAGVSHQTVSRVINGSERVLPETRARVNKAIKEMGYRPNAIAQSMAKGRSATLACIAPNLTDYTFASIINGAEQEARNKGYFLLSASAPDKGTFSALVEELVSTRRIEGILVINPYADGRYQHLPESFPTVFAGARPREEIAFSVALNDSIVAQQATQHLIGLGHKKIAMITGPMAEDCTQDRTKGFEAAMKNANLPIQSEYQSQGNWSADSGYAAFMTLAKSGAMPTAVFAQNDQMAVGVMKAATELGRKVPEQLSVIGIDDVPLAAYFSPPLTTMRQNFVSIGKEAVQLLMLAIDKPESPKQNKQHPAELIIRGSTSPI